LGEDIKTHSKYELRPINKWMTYYDAIELARSNIPLQEVVMLLNLDIFISEENNWDMFKVFLKKLIVLHKKPVIISCSRHEWRGSEKESFME